jgi:hypothetical protein
VATDAGRQINTMAVIETATGAPVDFGVSMEFELEMPNITYGRARWMPDGSALVYIGIDDNGRSGLWVQDFDPGRDTFASRRPLHDFRDDLLIETFGISPDGEHVVVSVLREIRALSVVDGLPELR